MMKIHRGKFMRSCQAKFRKMERITLPSSCSELICCPWSYTHWPRRLDEKKNDDDNNNGIPKDVPKGHIVVYVGEGLKRHVIKISLLNHPLFRALLDQARDEYGFTATSKLCLPCDESMFLDVIRCAASLQERKIRFWV